MINSITRCNYNNIAWCILLMCPYCIPCNCTFSVYTAHARLLSDFHLVQAGASICVGQTKAQGRGTSAGSVPIPHATSPSRATGTIEANLSFGFESLFSLLDDCPPQAEHPLPTKQGSIVQSATSNGHFGQKNADSKESHEQCSTKLQPAIPANRRYSRTISGPSGSMQYSGLAKKALGSIQNHNAATALPTSSTSSQCGAHSGSHKKFSVRTATLKPRRRKCIIPQALKKPVSEQTADRSEQSTCRSQGTDRTAKSPLLVGAEGYPLCVLVRQSQK